MSQTATRAHKEIKLERDASAGRAFIRSILADLRALETMLEAGVFERGVVRIGAEQEMFLVDDSYLPTPGVLRMVDALADSHFTTELGAFQLEANADPQDFSGSGFSLLEGQLNTFMEKVWKTADGLGMNAVLAGILPTLRHADLGIENMVPSPRYLALSHAVAEQRGKAFEFSITGVEELNIAHDTVMLEACNSSFQVHLQVDADQFAERYNLAQMLAGPLLALACNSPLLFGKRLWAETRIALFQQAVDTRSRTQMAREAAPRVTFGHRYLEKSITEIFREDVIRFKSLVGTATEEDSPAIVQQGGIPKLSALRTHSGTIYRWNRACYGVIDGKPHLRIENRIMPSGPTIADEVANAAFWCGLMVEYADRIGKVASALDFDAAASNFYTAAREGLGATMRWMGNRDVTAQSLVLDELLPDAEAGLRKRKVDEADIRRYLRIVEGRARNNRTGSRWQTESLRAMRSQATPSEIHTALVAGSITRQKSGKPVSEWDLAQPSEAGAARHTFQFVEQIMSTRLHTVQPDDAAELVANIMGWERVKYVLVEDRSHHLLGMVSSRALLRFLAEGGVSSDARAGDLMRSDLLTVTPRTLTVEAIRLMRQHRIGALPVVSDDALVGILTEENFLRIASEFLEAQLLDNA